ncbi:MAG: hypothetical protein FJ030_02940 [Chloroflexi bacterium]|nr:hypothetical protein [Chloroflexota bacterium]
MNKPNPNFAATHEKLRAIMEKYDGKGNLKLSEDKAGNIVLIGPPTKMSQGKEVWFGGVRTGKAYASYHLMAVYAFPDLLNDISPELKKRMQGKSCFNFRAVDEALFKELAQLTKKGYERFKKEKLIG